MADCQSRCCLQELRCRLPGLDYALSRNAVRTLVFPVERIAPLLDTPATAQGEQCEGQYCNISTFHNFNPPLKLCLLPQVLSLECTERVRVQRLCSPHRRTS